MLWALLALSGDIGSKMSRKWNAPSSAAHSSPEIKLNVTIKMEAIVAVACNRPLAGNGGNEGEKYIHRR